MCVATVRLSVSTNSYACLVVLAKLVIRLELAHHLSVQTTSRWQQGITNVVPQNNFDEMLCVMQWPCMARQFQMDYFHQEHLKLFTLAFARITALEVVLSKSQLRSR